MCMMTELVYIFNQCRLGCNDDIKLKLVIVPPKYQDRSLRQWLEELGVYCKPEVCLSSKMMFLKSRSDNNADRLSVGCRHAGIPLF